MRVLHIVTLGNLYYGAQNHVLHLTEGLLAEGHNVKIVVGSSGLFTEMLEQLGIDYECVDSLVHPIKPLKDLQAVFGIRKVIKDFQPDIVTTHSTKAGIVGRIAAWTYGLPNTFTAHGWSFAEGLPENRRKMALAIERAIARITSRIIAVADREREFGLANKVAPENKVVRIYYGVADEAGGLIERDAVKTQYTLTMVAGFRAQKDQATLIRALASIVDLPWRLDLIGDGEQMTKVQHLVSEHKLQDRVTFTGAVSNVSDYLRASDMQVLTTYYEGLPISTIEALAHSLPVIATKVAGTEEQVVDDYNGITVEREADQAVADAIRYLIENPAKRLEFGRNSRTLYENNFTNELMCKNTFELYQELIKG